MVIDHAFFDAPVHRVLQFSVALNSDIRYTPSSVVYELRIRAVFFDIGETLINETRPWSLLADWLAVPRMTMFGVLGGLIAEGRDHRELFDIVRPDIGWKGV